jgi:hypothetical protein
MMFLYTKCREIFFERNFKKSKFYKKIFPRQPQPEAVVVAAAVVVAVVVVAVVVVVVVTDESASHH